MSLPLPVFLPQVHVMVTQSAQGAYTYTLAAYLQVAGGHVLASTVSAAVGDPTAGFTLFTVSYGVSVYNELTCNVTIGFPFAMAQYSYWRSSFTLSTYQPGEYYVGASPYFPIYSSFVLQNNNQSALAGYLDELWAFKGPLNATQIQLLAHSNVASQSQYVNTSFGIGLTLTYQLSSRTATQAYNTSLMALDTNIEYDKTLSNTATAAGASGTLQVSFTLHTLRFTFESGNVMLALSPAEVSAQCGGASVGASASQQPPLAQFCSDYQSTLKTLAPVYITQNPTTGLFVNAYLQTNYPDEPTLMDMVSRLLKLLNWNNAEVPEAVDNQATVVGMKQETSAVSAQMTGQSQPMVAGSNAQSTVQPRSVQVYRAVLSTNATNAANATNATNATRVLPASYTTRGVHATLLRPVVHRHTVHHNPRSLITNQTVNGTGHIGNITVAPSVSPALQSLLARPEVAAYSAMCIEVNSVIDNDPASQSATPFDQYDTTVATCYQAGVGPVASQMQEQVEHTDTTLCDGTAHQPHTESSHASFPAPLVLLRVVTRAQREPPIRWCPSTLSWSRPTVTPTPRTPLRSTTPARVSARSKRPCPPRRPRPPRTSSPPPATRTPSC